MMRSRKVYLHGEVLGGEDVAYWEDVWACADLRREEARHRVSPDVVMRILSQHVPSTGRILETGSGRSTYAAAFRTTERTVYGLDYAREILARVNGAFPDLRLACGDVRRMPFADASFDCVISLGVVEHMSEGPVEALREHARVLAPGGLLLVSVPWLSIAKVLKDTWYLGMLRRTAYHARGRLVSREGVTPVPGTFHQFEHSRRVWHQYLRQAGLEPRMDVRHLVAAGVGELPFVSGLSRRNSRSASIESSVNQLNEPSARRSKLQHVLIDEVAKGRLETAGRSVSRHVAGHMILTVASHSV